MSVIWWVQTSSAVSSPLQGLPHPWDADLRRADQRPELYVPQIHRSWRTTHQRIRLPSEQLLAELPEQQRDWHHLRWRAGKPRPSSDFGYHLWTFVTPVTKYVSALFVCLIKVDGVTVSELFQELGLILWRMSERIITFPSVSDRGCPSSGYDHLSPTLMSLPIVR